MSIADNLHKLEKEVENKACIVAVSKYSEDPAVLEAYEHGHRHFGENKAQDLAARYERLPQDIHWHFIGHLQRNKVRYIAPFIHLIHSVDSLRLLREIDKRAAQAERSIDCLLQVHIAREESKFGLDADELHELLASKELAELGNIRIKGLMGMATNTEKEDTIRSEFSYLRQLYISSAQSDLPANAEMSILSMGMSQDYRIALQEGSNMLRVGSAIFS